MEVTVVESSVTDIEATWHAETAIIPDPAFERVIDNVITYQSLQMDGASGAVVGIEAERADGTKVTIDAAKGVILATGGYGSNTAMVQEYNNYWEDIILTTRDSIARVSSRSSTMTTHMEHLRYLNEANVINGSNLTIQNISCISIVLYLNKCLVTEEIFHLLEQRYYLRTYIGNTTCW